jgi:CheY-like chemotaxis protein
VVLNLVDNAIKFTEHGEVVVHVSKRAETPSEVRLQFTVTDTGIGVPADKQQRIFKPYDQGDPAVARRYGGTGLGLAVSSRLVRMMGGQVALSSRPGHGSAFGFTALFHRPAEMKVDALVEPSTFIQGQSVLVVDDNATSRRIIGEILERHRMDVLTAGNADEGRQAFQTGAPPAAVLVDSNLPGTDGFAYVAWLRQEASFKGPVVLMLTFTHLKRKSECAGLDVKATLLKPFGSRELIQALAKAIAARPGLSSNASEHSPMPFPVVEPAGTAPLSTRSITETVPSLRILVAEDTPVNQKFILRLLDRWGHSAVLVEDGRKAVAEAARSIFDLVLMDVQMPEMNGLEAAAAIRRHEAGKGRHTPIIAMTAHAIKGDRERCLAAGMDDYLSKPIDAEMLRQIIQRLTRMPPPSHSEKPPFLKAFENDWSFFEEIAEVFLSDYPRQIDSLRSSAEIGDAASFQRAAHSLKGMLLNFQAERPAEKALRLETQGRAGELSSTGPLIEELAGEIKPLEEQLRQLIERGMTKGRSDPKSD